MPTFGPGLFTVGTAGTQIEASCLVNSLTISMSKDTADPTTKLCGTVRPGAISYTYEISGNLDLDSDTATGLFALSQAQPGAQLPFTYTPSTADGTTATGVLVIDPLDFGGEEFGEDMTSDFTWDLIGKPVYTFGTGPAAGESRFKQIVINGRGATPEVRDVAPTSYDVATDDGARETVDA